MSPEHQAESRHPIGVVATRTGLPQDVIRAWERRYQAVTPCRGKTGRRLYSDTDVEKLRLLRRAVTGGRRISDVAGMTIEALLDLVADDHEPSGGGRPAAQATGRPAAVSTEVLLNEALEAMEAMDRHALEHALTEAAVQLSGQSLRRNLITPLLDAIGERWQAGTLRIAHEHLASTIVRSFMTSHRNGHEGDLAARIIVTTPAGQHHELGAIMAAAVAEEDGWDVYYLGPNLPAEEIAAASRQLGARALALSVVYRDGDRVAEEIRRLREMVGSVPIFVGGRAIDPIREKLIELGVICPKDLACFRADLQSVLA